VRSLLRLLGPYYRREWRLFLWGVCFVLAVNGLALYAPWATGHLIDKLVVFARAGGLLAHAKEVVLLFGKHPGGGASARSANGRNASDAGGS
jgi:ABC-type multidrug transport system fused ATPase/permease subunit